MSVRGQHGPDCDAYAIPRGHICETVVFRAAPDQCGAPRNGALGALSPGNGPKTGAKRVTYATDSRHMSRGLHTYPMWIVGQCQLWRPYGPTRRFWGPVWPDDV